MESEPSPGSRGITRREMLKRSAIVGGTLAWAAPAVQTLAQPAFAATIGSALQYSFVGVILDCGGTYYRMKWNDPSGSNLAPSACGKWTDDKCSDTFYPSSITSYSSSCAPGASATVNTDGSVTVSWTATGCSVVDWIWHKGQCCAVEELTQSRTGKTTSVCPGSVSTDGATYVTFPANPLNKPVNGSCC